MNQTQALIQQLGLMPHPERACDPVTGSTSGRAILEALLS